MVILYKIKNMGTKRTWRLSKNTDRFLGWWHRNYNLPAEKPLWHNNCTYWIENKPIK